MYHFLKFLLILLISSVAGCVITAFLTELILQTGSCFFENNHYRRGCDLDSFSEIIFDLIPSGILFSFMFVIFGHVLAFPALFLMYLPVSYAFWKAKIFKMWPYLLAGTAAAFANGVIFSLFQSAGFIAIFAATGFFTSLIHYFLLDRFFENKEILRPMVDQRG